MDQKLTKPVFVKLSELENGRSAYNVYVKVVSVEKSQTRQGGQPIARAVVADQTAHANAFFKGDNAKLIVEGAIIAIRNGLIKFIKNKISLEVDMFGRVTPQTVAIKSTNTGNNISEKEQERKPRRNNRDNRDNREQRQPRGQRREHRGGQHRGQHRGGQNRGQNRTEHRQPRGQNRGFRGGERRGGDRDFDRRQRRQDGDRRPRRDDAERKPRRDFEQRPRRQQGDRRPRREFEERPRREQDRGNRRPPTVFTKIGAIEPGDDNLNIFAQVIKCEEVGKRARVVLGDETGIIKAFLYKTDKVQVGATIVLFKGQAKVVKQHIELQVAEGGKVDEARKKITQVQKSVDISAKEWVQAD